MRIRRIGTESVLQYDSFDLDFGEDDTALHILYGPNEAGKSTLLQVIVDLLFGGKIDDAFQSHYDTRSRIEGVIEHQGHNPFHIQRKKRYSRLALTDGIQPELSEEMLVPYLGGYKKDQFSLLFGFDHDRLRNGGESLLQSGGHAGVSLFEAGGGVQYLQTLLKDLSDRSNTLLDPNFGARSAKLLNKEWRAYKEAEKEIRSNGLRGEEWERLRHEIEAKTIRLEELQQQKLQRLQEVSKLQRIQRVRNLMIERRDVLDQLQELATVTVLPAELDMRIPNILVSLDNSLKNRCDLEEQNQHQIETMEFIQADPLVLEFESENDAMNEGLQQYLSRKKEEIPKAEVQLEQYKRDATQLLKSIAPGVTLEEVETLRIPFVDEERIQQLADLLKQVLIQVETIQDRYDEVTTDRANMEKELAHIGEPGDISRLRSLLQEIRSDGDIEEALSKQQRELEQRRQALLVTMRSQTVWTGALNELTQLTIPLLETINRFHMTWTGAEKGLEDVCRDLQKARQDIEVNAVRLEELELGGQVPVEADLQAARQYRSDGWQLVKQVLQQEDLDTEQLNRFTGNQTLLDAFEKAIVRADDVADWMRRESDRSAQRAHLLLKKEQLERERLVLEELQEQKKQLLADLERQWRFEWKDCNLDLKTPIEMKEWVTTFYRPLVDGLSSLQSFESDYMSRLQRRDLYITRLQEALVTLQGDLTLPDEGLKSLLQVCDQLVLEADEKSKARSLALEKLQDCEQKVMSHAQRLGQAKQQLAKVESEWRELIKRYPLLPEDSEVVVRYVIQLRQLFQGIGDIEQLQSEITEKQRTCSRFENEATELADRLCEDVSQYPSLETWVRHVRERLRAAKDAHIRLEQIQKEADRLREQIRSLHKEVEEYQVEIERFLHEYECTDVDGLRILVHRSVEFKRLQELREQTENRLREAGDGLTVAQLEAEVTEVVDPDFLSARIQELQSKVKDLDKELEHAQQSLWELNHAFNQLDGSRSDAADQAQKAESHLAEVDRHWNEYLRVELACRLLKRSIEQFRQQNESFVLDRASEIFQMATLGRYKGLIIQYEGNDPYIEAIHVDGTKRRVHQMSDGTRDQLFLSMRLAFIDQTITQTNPLPLIMDDILVHFDDERTTATLEILHEIAGKTQILYFTHHRSVVEAAQKLLFNHRIRIHDLSSYHKKNEEQMSF